MVRLSNSFCSTTYPKSRIMQTHEKIRHLRELKKMTQEEVADALSMSTSGYSKIERGETRLNIDRLQKIADILEVNLFDLMPQNDSNIIYTLNGSYYNNFHNLIYENNNQYELEKFNIIIQNKDEVIAQKDREIERLQNLLDKLSEKIK